MKKKINKPMRAAGVLLVATMLTTCMTAGTFAKYTTTDSATDTARVAKFGVTVGVNGYLYGKEYADVNDATNSNQPISYTGTNTNTGTVQVYATSVDTAKTASNVVAPGTKNTTGLGFRIHGTPEVDCTVDITIEAKNIYLKKGNYGVMETIEINSQDELNATAKNGNIYTYTSDTWTKLATNANYDSGTTYCKLKDTAAKNDFNNADYYFPVIYTLDKGTSGTSVEYNNGTQTSDSLAAAISKLKESTAIQENTSTVNTETTGYTTATLKSWTQQANRSFEGDSPAETLKWEWKYEDNANKAKYDKLDTILGDLVAQDGRTKDETDTTFTKDIKTPGACRVVLKQEDDTYKVPTKATASDPSVTDHIGAITVANDYNLDTAVYFSATVNQVD